MPPRSSWPDPLSQVLVRAVVGLRRRLKRWVDAWIPQLTLFEDTVGAGVTHLLAAVARYGVADVLEEGPQTAEQLGLRLGLQADPLHRALRALAYQGYFQLDRRGRFCNNRLSRALLSKSENRSADFCRYFGSASNLAAWGALDSVLRTGHNGFQAVHGCSVWQWFAEHPEEEALFAGAMQGQTYGDAPLVAMTYPFSEVASVCDVGGGQGGLLSEIVLRHPHLQATLFDAAGVLEQARAKLAGYPIRLCSGDFFQEVPAGHQLYLLKSVLHDWSDERCVQILRNCARAMNAESRLLLVEFTPETHQADHFGVVSDVQMMVVTDNGRERSVAELRGLLQRSGLRSTRFFPTASVTLMEARL